MDVLKKEPEAKVTDEKPAERPKIDTPERQWEIPKNLYMQDWIDDEAKKKREEQTRDRH